MHNKGLTPMVGVFLVVLAAFGLLLLTDSVAASKFGVPFAVLFNEPDGHNSDGDADFNYTELGHRLTVPNLTVSDTIAYKDSADIDDRYFRRDEIIGQSPGATLGEWIPSFGRPRLVTVVGVCDDVASGDTCQLVWNMRDTDDTVVISEADVVYLERTGGISTGQTSTRASATFKVPEDWDFMFDEGAQHTGGTVTVRWLITDRM